METMSQQAPNRYTLVSSLYGPGTIACWYLTISSVLVSWTLHPKKRVSGSIDVDLIAILTLPAVAAGHLIWQVSKLIHGRDGSPNLSLDADQYAQVIAAIEAPISVIESFMAISVVLFLIAAWMLCLRRLIAVAIVGLLCFVTECYVCLSNFRELGIRYDPSSPPDDDRPTFNRSFVADFTGLVVAITVILALCATLASAIFTFMLTSRGSHLEVARAEQGGLDNSPRNSNRAPVADNFGIKSADAIRASRRVSSMSTFFLLATGMLTALPAAGNAIQFPYQMLAATGGATAHVLWSRLKIFAAHFYPHSNNSFSELDQAVEAAAGATILVFSIYNVASARRAARPDLQARRAGVRGIELHRLSGD